MCRAFYNDKKIVVIFDLFRNLKEKTDMSLLVYCVAKSMNVAVIYISENVEDSYVGYDVLYKYLPEDKKFSVFDYRI